MMQRSVCVCVCMCVCGVVVVLVRLFGMLCMIALWRSRHMSG